ncbi:hypothetical protein BC830DRAFT_1123731 [Chytriomyces sp. MP71]|nr:hypothetical protein BC830DRAFT_1123731 [Chytriomyces sp. MP71]
MTPSQLAGLRLVFRTVGVASAVCNMLVIVFVVRLKQFHKPLQYLQAILAASEVIQSIIYMIGNEIAASDVILCNIVGAVAHFIFTFCLLQNFIISLYCFISIMYRPSVADACWNYYHAYVWGVSTILLVVLFLMQALWQRGDVFGDATYECWISYKYAELRVDLFYIPLSIHFAMLVYMYSRILFRVSQVQKSMHLEGIQTGVIPPLSENCEEDSEATHTGKSILRRTKSIRNATNEKLLLKAGWLACGYVLSWTAPCATRLLALVPGAQIPYWLSVWGALGLASCGLWNSGIFFISWFWNDIVKLFRAKS